MLAACVALSVTVTSRAADSRAHSDSNARYLHHIHLYDIDNRKITPESTRPYSTMNTCGRCHDYETISHGWHFNAFLPDSAAGRQGEPWVWTEKRTGTQLPLSYRDWPHTYEPDAIGITPWQMTHQFGGRLPGGNMWPDGKAAGTESAPTGGQQTLAEDERSDQPQGDAAISRWQLAGKFEIDCMICHAVSGAYDFDLRRRQIADENFAWAPTAALRLGVVDGEVSRIKDDEDPSDEATKKKLPQVAYDPSLFAADDTVFMDLVREPTNNACYQCHSSRTVDAAGIEPRWIHDEDVHLRAGMACVDCHRNGIDHHIVRGFDGEQHPSGRSVETLSCSGCHLGQQHDGEHISEDVLARAGRLGAPKPLHAGLPPLHFEKMSCTACHSGPVPRDEAIRMMTSLAHGLGEKGHRSGLEMPAIVGPVYAKGDDGRVFPQRSMWPAYWGTIQDGKVVPMPPEQVYDLTRRALRVRKDFIEEVLQPKLSSTQMKEILGEERARLDEDDWSDAEREKVEVARAEQGRQQFNEKVYAALEAIETEMNVEGAVYVSSGMVYARGQEENSLKTIDVADDKATGMISWPLAHNVRPAGWSLGVAGCLECHSENGKIFASTVSPVGPTPDRGPSMTMASLQGVDPDQRIAWNELFRGRKSFKYIIAGSISLLVLTLFVGVGAIAARLAGRTT